MHPNYSDNIFIKRVMQFNFDIIIFYLNLTIDAIIHNIQKHAH